VSNLLLFAAGNKIISLLISSFPKILLRGLIVTIPLTVISFGCAMVIATFVAMIQYAKVPIARKICQIYIWIFRGTPLLIQLYVVFFGLPNLGIMIEPFPCAVLVFAFRLIFLRNTQYLLVVASKMR
jgi:cystine transport system permease protein